MNVNQVYLLMQYAVSKNLQQGYLSPNDFDITINQAQNSYLDYLLGEYQKYQPTRPFPPVAFANNQRVRTSIAPLIYEVIMPVDNTTGIAEFPYGFQQVDAMWSQYNFDRIRFTQQDKVWSNNSSVIDPVSTNPIYYMNEQGFRFLPATIGLAKMSYVRGPNVIHWGYTEDANGIPVYDEATSTQPVWSETDMLQVIVRALAIVGVNLQFATVQQYSESIKQGGQ